MRVTMLVRSTAGLEARLKARTARQRQRVVEATVENAAEVAEAARQLCPIDTGHMQSKVRVEIGGEGDRFAVGFRSEDFVGQTNPAGRVITAFYPVFVIFGTRFMAGRDVLTAALRSARASTRARYKRALTE